MRLLTSSLWILIHIRGNCTVQPEFDIIQSPWLLQEYGVNKLDGDRAAFYKRYFNEQWFFLFLLTRSILAKKILYVNINLAKTITGRYSEYKGVGRGTKLVYDNIGGSKRRVPLRFEKETVINKRRGTHYHHILSILTISQICK